MKTESVLREKSFDFAVRIINLYKYLKEIHKEYVISRQLLRAGTAIGALLQEAEFAESKGDFIHKLHVGLKEANESLYWLKLLYKTNFIDKKMFDSMHEDISELLKMLVASLKTSKKSA